MNNVPNWLNGLQQGDKRTLARIITVVENELEGHEELLTQLTFPKKTPIIGITGPPGAGKSTFINSLITHLLTQPLEGRGIGIIAIDPTSPFNFGSILGDRLRMAEHFNNDKVFIRSLATRGSLGGLSAKIIEVVDVMRAFDFDYIFIETVGVGQSEVEIVGLADTSILVLVPESGDEVQTIKSGIMEIADIFVVNKADRDGADAFVKNLHALLQFKNNAKSESDWVPPVIKTVATKNEGIEEISKQITRHSNLVHSNHKQSYLLAEKAYRLIQNSRMKDVDKQDLQKQIDLSKGIKFNLYHFIKKYLKSL